MEGIKEIGKETKAQGEEIFCLLLLQRRELSLLLLKYLVENDYSKTARMFRSEGRSLVRDITEEELKESVWMKAK